MNAPAPTRTGPSISRHKSSGTWGTPRVFLDAVEKRFGPIAFDLAATSKNAVVSRYFGPDHKNPTCRDALKNDWSEIAGNRWLNPEFGNIAPWAEQCATVNDLPSWTLLLVPASVDSEWYWKHVYGKAFVMPLRGRIQFVGAKDPYPKGLALAAFGFGVSGFEPWKWKSTDRKRKGKP